MTRAEKACPEEFPGKIRRVEDKQDENARQRRAIEEAQCDIEGFYAWAAQWRAECADMLGGDARSLALVDSLSASSAVRQSEGRHALEEALDDNRRERKRLDDERDALVEMHLRSLAAREREGGFGGH